MIWITTDEIIGSDETQGVGVEQEEGENSGSKRKIGEPEREGLQEDEMEELNSTCSKDRSMAVIN